MKTGLKNKSDEELRSLHDVINDGIHTTEIGKIVTLAIVKFCISKLNCGKDGDDYGFKSYHIFYIYYCE